MSITDKINNKIQELVQDYRIGKLSSRAAAPKSKPSSGPGILDTAWEGAKKLQYLPKGVLAPFAIPYGLRTSSERKSVLDSKPTLDSIEKAVLVAGILGGVAIASGAVPGIEGVGQYVMDLAHLAKDVYQSSFPAAPEMITQTLPTGATITTPLSAAPVPTPDYHNLIPNAMTLALLAANGAGALYEKAKKKLDLDSLVGRR